MSAINTAVILAAGYGKRLKPFTDHIPKPAMPIANDPSIIRIINNLERQGISAFHVNTHHLANSISAILNPSASQKIHIVHEPVIRDTGGGVENFRPVLKDASFVLHNADIYHEQDLQELIASHIASKALVTLMAVDAPEFNSLIVEDNNLLGISRREGKLTYSGVAIFSPAVWDYFPSELCFSLVDVFYKVMSVGLPIRVFKSTAYWNDFGTVERYFQLHQRLARRQLVNIHPESKARGCDLRGFSYIAEGCELRDCYIEDSIILPGSRMANKEIKSSVVLGDIIVPVKP